MTQEVTRHRKDIRDLIQSDNVKEQLAMVLPKYLTADRMARVACTAVLKTPKLAQCKPESLLQALMLCAQAGLEPDGRNAHLIPYGNDVQVIFDYKGLVALARRNGVQNIASELVCENDRFDWWRNHDGLQFEHRVDWRKPRGEVQAVFCIWKDGDGQFDGEVMTKDEVEGIRRRSRAGNNGPWKTDWNEMARKTVIRRASKRWPIASELAEAIMHDEVPQTSVHANQPARPNFIPLPEVGSTDSDDDSNPDLAPADPETKPEPAPEKPKRAKTITPLEELAGKMAEVGMTFDMLVAANKEAGDIVPMLADKGGLEELSAGQVKCVLAEWDKLTAEGGAE